MIVNGKKYDIETLLEDFQENFLVDVGNIMLTKREIEVLEKNFIDYKSTNSLRDLVLKIEYFLDSVEDDIDLENEIDSILESISERIYYFEVKK